MRFADNTFFLKSKLGSYNPTAKLLAALFIAVGLLVSDDAVSASLAIFVEAVSLVIFKVSYRAAFKKALPLFLAAISLAVANIIASKTAGLIIAGISLRLVAISFPGILLFASTDPIDLADSLVQQCHLSPRYAYSSLAAFRLLPLLSEEWSLIVRARRSRGIDYGGRFISKFPMFFTSVFSLLVAAIRKGTRLAFSMDAKGFNLPITRTSARQQLVHKKDTALVVSAFVMILSINAISISLGFFHPVLLHI